MMAMETTSMFAAGKTPVKLFPKTTETTSETAKTRTPSASARKTKKMPAVNLRMWEPKRLPINS